VDFASLANNQSPYEIMVDGGRECYQGLSLLSEVDAKGANFSHGQRQVLSLYRVLIRKSQLILLDEATASMDYEADKNMQNVLREELRMTGGRTLVTIAHRLRTIMDYDAVIVIEASRVIGYGYCFLSFAIHVIRSDEY
jgi:ABC-type multidrug transport system fused ATPase/permease subunit